MPPESSFAESGAETFGGVPEKGDAGHSRKDAALPQNQIRMKMADNRLLNLRDFRANCFILPQERQSSWIVAKKQHALFRAQCGKRATNFVEMNLAQALP